MSDKVWFEFYPNDWLQDDFVKSLSLDEKGAYISLLLHQASTGGVKEEEIEAILGVPKTDPLFHRIWNKISPKFHPEKDWLVNRKMQAAVSRSTNRTEQAKNAASARWGISFGATSSPKPAFDLISIWTMFPKREHATGGKSIGLEMLKKIVTSEEVLEKLKASIENYKAFLKKRFPNKEERVQYTKRFDNWLEDWEDWYKEEEKESPKTEAKEPEHVSLWAEANWCRANRKLKNFPPGQRFPWEKQGSLDFGYSETAVKAKWTDEVLREWLKQERK